MKKFDPPQTKNILKVLWFYLSHQQCSACKKYVRASKFVFGMCEECWFSHWDWCKKVKAEEEHKRLVRAIKEALVDVKKQDA